MWEWNSALAWGVRSFVVCRFGAPFGRAVRVFRSPGGLGALRASGLAGPGSFGAFLVALARLPLPASVLVEVQVVTEPLAGAEVDVLAAGGALDRLPER